MKTVYKSGAGEVIEKKSRFIATVVSVNSEMEALEFITKMKKKYWDAAHNCSAFVIGDNYEIQRFSDDGEPGGTAGKPMLDVLVGNQIHNAAVVVTRYFGGTLLGTGGLVRAYQKAVNAGLKQCELLTKQQGLLINIHLDYKDIGKIQHVIETMHLHLMNTQYLNEVNFEVIILNKDKELVINKIADVTNGKAAITIFDKVSFGIVNDKCILI